MPDKKETIEAGNRRLPNLQRVRLPDDAAPAADGDFVGVVVETAPSESPVDVEVAAAEAAEDLIGEAPAPKTKTTKGKK